MSYGAFVKLEDGIEGLVHISEMSWTKRISHPSELVHIDDEVEVMVLDINQEKQEISLGMKQTQSNPWDKVADRYPPGTHGQRHGPQPHQLRRVHRDRRRHRRPAARQRHVVDPQDRPSQRSGRKGPGSRVQGGLASTRNAAASPWASSRWTTIPGRPTSRTATSRARLVNGKVTKITNFGVFVGLEDGLEGLLHISELADHKVENPEDVVKVGDEIEVKILRVDADERKIGLSRKRVEWAEEDAAAEDGAAPTARPTRAGATELKGGVGSGIRPALQAGRDSREARLTQNVQLAKCAPSRTAAGSSAITRHGAIVSTCDRSSRPHVCTSRQSVHDPLRAWRATLASVARFCARTLLAAHDVRRPHVEVMRAIFGACRSRGAEHGRELPLADTSTVSAPPS